MRDALLSASIFSRPGKPLAFVKAIVVHYLGNPGQSAMGARNYWEGLKTQDAADANPDISASAHFVVDLDGEVLRTIPESEKAYHCGAAKYTPEAQAYFGHYCKDPAYSPNRCTIGVELCHPKADGRPTDETRASAVALVAELCKRYNLNPMLDVWRHHDVTGKDCPRYYVTEPAEWAAFLRDVDTAKVAL